MKQSSHSINQEDTPSKSHRKDIRKILSDKKVSAQTKEAATEERERRKRMEEKQKAYNEIFELKEGKTLDKLVLDFNRESKVSYVNNSLVCSPGLHRRF